jgi:V8-like Glu-specific endopeptidase
MQTIRSLVPFLLIAALAAPAASQQINPPALPLVGTVQAHDFAFAPVANGGATLAVVAESVLRFPGRTFVQIEFDRVFLPDGGFLEITSLADGAQQLMSGPEFHVRRGHTAYFNGDAVRIRMFAAPHTEGNVAAVKTVSLGLAEILNPQTICGSTDDRVNSNERRSCRLLLRTGGGTSACTGWLISPTNCFATAGHCLDISGLTLVTAQFNVPQSNSNGSINNPPPSDQYDWEGVASALWTNGGVGNDWGVFRSLPNAVTSQHAGAVQGDYFRIGTPPSNGSPITITGNGSASGTRNLTTKTHTGPLSTQSSTTLCYATDTTGGNSGSPVIDANTNRAIGVHTHGGCTSTGGCNSGTNAGRSQFAAARAQICSTPGSYTTFGLPCAGSNGLPLLGNSGLPQIGVPFNVTLANARANSSTTLLVGLSNTQWAGLTLPFNLSVIGGIGCNLYASGDIQLGTATDAAGAASIPITFANNSALVGLLFYNQYVIFDPFNSLGLVFTNRGDGTVGG